MRERQTRNFGTVGRDVHIAPIVKLTEYGKIVDKHINIINTLGKGLTVDKYIIMPNHVHIIIVLGNGVGGGGSGDCGNGERGGGAMKTSRPTTIPNILRSFKTMVSKDIGFSLWQASFYDHVIRDEEDYLRIWKYIDENPLKWSEDEYFVCS